jgi:hypothetical protein
MEFIAVPTIGEVAEAAGVSHDSLTLRSKTGRVTDTAPAADSHGSGIGNPAYRVDQGYGLVIEIT